MDLLEQPLLVVRLGDRHFGFPLREVREMVAVPTCHALPAAPSAVRGVINLRGTVMSLVDLRVRLGMPSLRSELGDLVDMLLQRENDHRRWLDELEASVCDDRPFTLATDPIQCAFGRWYHGFKTNNASLSFQLRKLETVGISTRDKRVVVVVPAVSVAPGGSPRSDVEDAWRAATRADPARTPSARAPSCTRTLAAPPPGRAGCG